MAYGGNGDSSGWRPVDPNPVTISYAPPVSAPPTNNNNNYKNTYSPNYGANSGGGGANQVSGFNYSPPPPPQTLEQWLAGDTTYQQQLNEFNASKAAYQQQHDQATNQINQNYDATNRQMNRQAGVDRLNQQYDFAGRGVLNSGVYAKALGDYNTGFQQQLDNLLTGRNQQLTTQDTDLNNFLRQLQVQQDAARQDAVARRALQYGLSY